MLTRKLRNLRKSMKLSQEQVAAVLHIDRSTYSYYETGKTVPPLDKLIKLAKIFNVSLNEFTSLKAFTVVNQSGEFTPPVTNPLLVNEPDLIDRYRRLPDEEREKLFRYIDAQNN